MVYRVEEHYVWQGWFNIRHLEFETEAAAEEYIRLEKRKLPYEQDNVNEQVISRRLVGQRKKEA